MKDAPLGITVATFTPACLRTWDLVRSQLPDDHAGRWFANRVVQPHGTRRTVLLWRIWDSRCTRYGLSGPYFCWCLNYDPEHYYNRETHWQFHLYANTIRLYRHADILRSLLPRRLKEVCPKGFRPRNDDHSTQLVWNFQLEGALDSLPERIAPKVEAALLATAPVFDEVFDRLGQAGGEPLQAHRRPSARPVANPDAEPSGGILSRSIRPALRRRILEQHGHRCWICGKSLQETDEIHVDHTLPWSKGGLTEADNLRPAHAACNLSKGGRADGGSRMGSK